MTAKEFLFSLGVTNDPAKSLIVLRGYNQFDIAEIMERYVNAELPSLTINTQHEAFVAGRQDGFIWNATYYPITGPVPRALDRKFAVMTIGGPRVVHEGDYLIKDKSGQVTDIVSPNDLVAYCWNKRNEK